MLLQVKYQPEKGKYLWLQMVTAVFAPQEKFRLTLTKCAKNVVFRVL